MAMNGRLRRAANDGQMLTASAAKGHLIDMRCMLIDS